MKVEKTTARVWSRRFERWYSQVIHFRKPASKRIDLHWCVEADFFIFESLKEHALIKEAVALGNFAPTSSEINQTLWAIKNIKRTYADYKEIWQAINADPMFLSRLSKSEVLDDRIIEKFRIALVPGDSDNVKVLVYLRDYDKMQALRQKNNPKPRRSSGVAPA